MLARTVYPVLALAPRRLAHQFPVLGLNWTNSGLSIGTGKVSAGGSPPAPGEINAAVCSKSRQIAAHEARPYPGPFEDRTDAGIQPCPQPSARFEPRSRPG